ncbi:MAG: hypothetical protein ACI8VT_003850, partial [Saprospiraceae bacterium]
MVLKTKKMKLLTTQTKITKFIESNFISNIENWLNLLAEGD